MVSAIPRQIPTYLAQAVLVTLLCFLPFGIVALIFASQVKGKLQAGDYAGAQQASKKAKTWCWLAFGVGLALTILLIVLAVVAPEFLPTEMG
jgi:Na+-driven multidrug efflux pump